MTKVLSGARIVTDGKILNGMDVCIDNGRITEICPHNMYEHGTVDLSGLILAPGFIDLHVHGGGGFEFIDGTEEAFRAACEVHAAGGTRVMYPTISATDKEAMVRVLETAEKVMHNLPVRVPGIHLEGPYLEPSMCGGQDSVLIRRPDPDEYLPILERFAPIIARWDYAPENDDGTFLNALKRYRVLPAIAHSAAEYDTVLNAYEGDCRLVTHLYSCTSTVVRRGGFRHLGIIESAFLLDGMDVEAIADGCHIPAELMRMIVKIKSPAHTALITDAIRCAGMKDSAGLVSGTERIPYIIEDGVAKLADRSAFAGSIATTQQLLKRTVQAGIPLETAVQMMTETPARIMGLKGFGSIKEGNEAVFTAFDEELKIIKL